MSGLTLLLLLTFEHALAHSLIRSVAKGQSEGQSEVLADVASDGSLTMRKVSKVQIDEAGKSSESSRKGPRKKKKKNKKLCDSVLHKCATECHEQCLPSGVSFCDLTDAQTYGQVHWNGQWSPGFVDCCMRITEKRIGDACDLAYGEALKNHHGGFSMEERLHCCKNNHCTSTSRRRECNNLPGSSFLDASHAGQPENGRNLNRSDGSTTGAASNLVRRAAAADATDDELQKAALDNSLASKCT